MVKYYIKLLNVIRRAREAAFRIIGNYPQDLQNLEHLYVCFILKGMGMFEYLPTDIMAYIFEFVLMMPEQAMREREVVVDALRQICEPYESRPFNVVRMMIRDCISLEEAEGIPTWDLFCVKGLGSNGSIKKFELCYLYQGKVVPLDSRPRITFNSPPPRAFAPRRYEYGYPSVRRLRGVVFEPSPMSLPISLVIDMQQRRRHRRHRKRGKNLGNIKRINLVNRWRDRRHHR